VTEQCVNSTEFEEETSAARFATVQDKLRRIATHTLFIASE
jgi:hypothetical protein